ncbi:trypsin-like serine protease [Euzebya rosea]|uniref:trypsin-like serine protease n=1 Tax=Euzebya rosea TaxID=2052804 RepID=UPI0014750063|nr:trypsin-like serine protease [Euzebya rosea]
MRRLLLAFLAMALVLPLAPSATAEDYHIVNGTAAPQGAYPWMAAFLFDGGQGCGGSVIAPNWILTASHCVADDRGQPSVAPGSATFVVNANDWTDGSGQTLTAAEIIIHPNYDAATTDNDVALVRTNETTDVTPVRIATAPEQNPAPGTEVRVIGYGTTSSGGDASNTLLQVDVPIVSDADCANGYGNLNAPNMLCAGAPTQDEANPGRDSCQGDSGGPLFVPGDQPVQIGVVSFGIGCGAPLPGVYAEVSTYAEWIQGIVGGGIQPGDPDPGPVGEQPTGAADMVVRIQGQTDPNGAVDNAIAISQYVFQTPGVFGVLAASANFPDALGGSALASYFGPLLYVNPDGTLSDATLREFQRALDQGSTIYVLGGTAVIGPEVVTALEGAGFVVERLAGAGRQQTALVVANKVNEVVNGQQAPPFDSVIVAYEGNWPDAVTVGSISGWFGIPVLLTPTAELGGPAAQYLQENLPTQVMVLGGDAVISQNVRDQIQGIIGEDGFVQPLFGASRFETAADIAFYTRELFTSNDEIFEFEGEAITEPDVLVAVNLEQPDAFTHVLAASSLVGNFGGLFVAVDGAGGFRDPIVPAICGIDKQVFAIGSTSLVTDEATQQIQAASAGTSCDPDDPFGFGG